MSFADSLLGRIRKVWGSQPIVFPGAAVVMEKDGHVLLVRRVYDGRWQVPAGYSEEKESAEETAVRECREELGITLRDLACFGLGSTPEKFTHAYPNGDVVYSFVACFHTSVWDGEPQLLDGENSEARFFPLTELPDTLSSNSRHVMEGYGAFKHSGIFQLM